MARIILIKAQNGDAIVPCDSRWNARHQDSDDGYSTLKGQSILEQVETITDHLAEYLPGLSLNHGKGCEIPKNAYWGLQIYLGLRENLVTNEDARSFVYVSIILAEFETDLLNAYDSILRALRLYMSQ